MKAENNSFLIELAFSKSEQYTASPSSTEAFVQCQLPEGGFSKTFLPAANALYLKLYEVYHTWRRRCEDYVL